MKTQGMFDEPTSGTDGASPATPQLSVRASQKEFRALAKPLERVLDADLKSAEGIVELEKALRAIPDDLADKVLEARDAAISAIDSERTERANAMKRARASFIEGLRRDGIAMREIDAENWRVGRLQLEFDTANATIAIRYNEDKISGDLQVADEHDIERHVTDANKLLDDSVLPTDVLVKAMSDAYEFLQAQSGSADGKVKLKDLHAELRVAALRVALGKRPGSKIAPRAMPVWAYLHNLDQYRALGSQVPAQARVGFVTGSQSETARFGMTLGGLQPDQAYRRYCYISREAR